MQYSLQHVEEAYSYYGKLPFVYNLLHNQFFLRKRAISKLGLKQGCKVLDIACGTGLNLKHIKKLIGKNGRITGIDYTEEMLNRAKKLIKRKKWRNISLVKKDISCTNLPEGHFDVAISTLGFSAIPDHKKALKNVVASLKKGGRLVMLEGKLFNLKVLNIVMPLLRWNKSWDRKKDIIKDIKQLFPKKQINIEEYTLGSNFILELTK